MLPISEIFPYIVSAGGAYAWLRASKFRRSNEQKAEADVYSSWREINRTTIAEQLELIKDMKREMGEMRQEIFMLREIVESYKASCDGCPNNKKKKNETN